MRSRLLLERFGDGAQTLDSVTWLAVTHGVCWPPKACHPDPRLIPAHQKEGSRTLFWGTGRHSRRETRPLVPPTVMVGVDGVHWLPQRRERPRHSRAPGWPSPSSLFMTSREREARAGQRLRAARAATPGSPRTLSCRSRARVWRCLHRRAPAARGVCARVGRVVDVSLSHKCLLHTSCHAHCYHAVTHMPPKHMSYAFYRIVTHIPPVAHMANLQI